MAAPSGSTSRLALPYPIPDDNVDVPRDIQALATKLDLGVATDAQGTLAARPAAGVVGRYYFATDAGVLYRDTGAAWVPIGPAAAIPTVTALPSGAVAGQEVYYQAPSGNMVSFGVRWHLRFGGSAWEFVGGAPLRGNTLGDALTLGGGTQWSTTLGDGANACQVTAPLAGDYYCWSNGFMRNPGGLYEGGIGAGLGTGPHFSCLGAASGNGSVGLASSGIVSGVTAGAAIVQYYLYVLNQITYGARALAIVPIRLSAV